MWENLSLHLIRALYNVVSIEVRIKYGIGSFKFSGDMEASWAG